MNAKDIAGLEGLIVGLALKIAELELVIVGLALKIAGLEWKIAGLELKIAGLELVIAGLCGKAGCVHSRISSGLAIKSSSGVKAGLKWLIVGLANCCLSGHGWMRWKRL